MRTIAIGDIHGCFYTFAALLHKVGYNSSKDTLIFLGDYIDRGPHSYTVVDALIQLQRKHGKDKCICLRGNHEQFAIDNNGCLDFLWSYNGGYQTIDSYERHDFSIQNHMWWYRSLPIYYQTDKFIFCHAGLTYPDLLSNTPNEILWNRAWMEIDSRPREKKVVFGHTPMREVPFFVKTGDICIDGGCVFDGNLCAMIIDENGNYSFEHVPKSEKDNLS